MTVGSAQALGALYPLGESAALSSAQTTGQSPLAQSAFAQTLQNAMGISAYAAQLPGGSVDAASALSGGMGALLPALSGSADDTKNALLMLCAMLSMGESGASSELTAILFSAIAKMTGEESTPAARETAEVIRQDVMDADYSEEVLDKVNDRVFKNTDAIPYQAWAASDALLKNAPGERSSSAYRAVIDQFDVEHNGRYKVNKKGTGDTYCNIFVWDVTRAMGAEIPHRYNPKTGEAYKGEGYLNMNANRMYHWLEKFGPKFGWKEVAAEEAQQYANAGFPAVTTFLNTGGGSGHVQMVCPSRSGAFDPAKGVTVAQAGSKLRSYTHTSNIFAARSLPKVRYYVHS